MFAVLCPQWLFFFFNDTATTEIYTLSLHDALPIYRDARVRRILEQQPQHPTADQPRRTGDERGTGGSGGGARGLGHLLSATPTAARPSARDTTAGSPRRAPRRRSASPRTCSR